MMDNQFTIFLDVKPLVGRYFAPVLEPAYFVSWILNFAFQIDLVANHKGSSIGKSHRKH